MRRIVIAASIIAGAAGIAAAQDSGRYAMEKTRDGYVRMDRRTGEMSLCTERAGQLVCRIAADERSAMQDDFDRLARRLEAIEKRLAEIEARQPAVRVVPSEEEMETALNFMQRFFRSFADIVRDLDKPAGDGEGSPDRT